MKPENVEKIQLGIFPTPLQEMKNLEEKIGVKNLYIKRDDMTDVGMSGNKIRKLEYLIKEAMGEGCDTLLTYGGPQTNHGRLVVASAVRCKMHSVLLLDGERPAYASGNIILDEMMGADVRFIGDGDKEKLTQEIIDEYAAKGHKVYVIPVGGSNAVGALGYVNMVKELMEQMKEMNIAPKYIVSACGSMGTFCGLWAGIKYYNAPFEVIPVAVNPKTTYREDKAAALINEISEKYELGFTCKPEELHLNFGRGNEIYAGVAYNTPDEQTQEAMRVLASTEAIFTDPCYSGKTFHGYLDMVQNVLPKDSGVVFLHTGGVPAIWTKEHLDFAQNIYWNKK